MIHRRAFVAGLSALYTAGLAGCSSGGAGKETAGAEALAEGEIPLAELMKEGPLGDKFQGRADAPVTIIEYASLTCPYCNQFHKNTYPKLKKAYIDTGKVRYIVREFPIGRTAAAAAVVTRCAPEKDYFTLFEKYLVQREVWISQEVRPDAIYKVAAQTGMPRDKFDSCLANQTIIDGLVWVKERGRQFGVVGTPTFFINGKKARGVLTFEE
ncbi:MAG: DsbA family protein, partial [Pseudomonadota bacterium]|nr:DsbA family protein [Pseudomonadota bacterium]